MTPSPLPGATQPTPNGTQPIPNGNHSRLVKAAASMMYFFIGGVSQDIDCDTLSYHIQDNTPSHVIPASIQELSPRGNTKAFKVYIPKDKKDELLKANWQSPIKVEPFKAQSAAKTLSSGNKSLGTPYKPTKKYPHSFPKGPPAGWGRTDETRYHDPHWGPPPPKAELSPMG